MANFLTIAEFCKSQGFTQINKLVDENVNGYPFITFITGDNKAENVYFSKKASSHRAKGEVVTASMLKEHRIAIVKNSAGEERIKLCGAGESLRLDLSDLL